MEACSLVMREYKESIYNSYFDLSQVLNREDVRILQQSGIDEYFPDRDVVTGFPKVHEYAGS